MCHLYIATPERSSQIGYLATLRKLNDDEVNKFFNSDYDYIQGRYNSKYYHFSFEKQPKILYILFECYYDSVDSIIIPKEISMNKNKFEEWKKLKLQKIDNKWYTNYVEYKTHKLIMEHVLQSKLF